MKPFLTMLAIFCGYLTGAAQEEFVLPQAHLLTKIHFAHLSGGIVIVKAQIDDYPDSLNFVFDTGSGGISLDSATADYLKLKKVKTDRTIRGIAGMKTVEFANNHSLKFPGLTTDHLDFHINDYDLLTSVYGIKIDGVMGYSFLRRYIARIDYDNFLIEIYSPGSFRYPRGGVLLKPNFSTLPMQSAIINDERAIVSRFIF